MQHSLIVGKVLNSKMEPQQLQNLAEGIAILVTGIRDDEQRHRDAQGVKRRIREQIDSITKCDGLIAQEVRDWVDSITLSCRLVRDIDNHALLLVTGTIRGPLRNEVERFLSLQQDRLRTAWPLVRDHVRNTFLGGGGGGGGGGEGGRPRVCDNRWR